MTTTPSRRAGSRSVLRPALAILLLAAAPAVPQAEMPMGPGARPAPYAPGPADLFAGRFQLRDPAGRAVDSDALAGRAYGLFFGFTGCPDICPTTLSQISHALRALTDPALRIYFITVDPERDTPAVLGAYMESFDPRIVALTGPRPAVDEAVASFGIVAERTALPGGHYTYGHTAAVLIVDENGLIVDRIAAAADTAALVARLSRLARPVADQAAGATVQAGP